MMTNSATFATQVGGQRGGERGHPRRGGEELRASRPAVDATLKTRQATGTCATTDATLNATLIGGLRAHDDCTTTSPRAPASSSSSQGAEEQPEDQRRLAERQAVVVPAEGQVDREPLGDHEQRGQHRPPQLRVELGQRRRNHQSSGSRGGEQPLTQPDQAVSGRSGPGQHTAQV